MDGSPGSPFTTTEAAARESARAAIRKLLHNEPDSPSKHTRSATTLATAAAAPTPIARKKQQRAHNPKKRTTTNKKTTKSVGSGVIHDDDESPQKGRSPNFQPSEDEALCRAYVNCSTNAIKGTDQKCEVFWTQIADVFIQKLQDVAKEDKPGVERTWQSLFNRFTKTILHDINKFTRLHLDSLERPVDVSF